MCHQVQILDATINKRFHIKHSHYQTLIWGQGYLLYPILPPLFVCCCVLTSSRLLWAVSRRPELSPQKNKQKNRNWTFLEHVYVNKPRCTWFAKNIKLGGAGDIEISLFFLQSTLEKNNMWRIRIYVTHSSSKFAGIQWKKTEDSTGIRRKGRGEAKEKVDRVVKRNIQNRKARATPDQK